jgi:hypothetical protein
MSALFHLAVVATATPVPSPEVVRQTIVENVPQGTPAVVVQAAQVAGVFAAGLVLSVAHRVVEYVTAREKGWEAKINVPLTSAYTVGVGLVGAATMGKLGVNASDLVTLVITSGVASIGTFWSYAVRKALSFVNGTATPAPTVSGGLVPPAPVDPANVG